LIRGAIDQALNLGRAAVFEVYTKPNQCLEWLGDNHSNFKYWGLMPLYLLCLRI